MRLLPCRPEPDQAAGGPREPEVGESELARSARNISGSTACSCGTRDQSNFIFQLLHTYKPGTLDTSLVSTDSIINPRTMNAIYIWSRRG